MIRHCSPFIKRKPYDKTPLSLRTFFCASTSFALLLLPLTHVSYAAPSQQALNPPVSAEEAVKMEDESDASNLQVTNSAEMSQDPASPAPTPAPTPAPSLAEAQKEAAPSNAVKMGSPAPQAPAVGTPVSPPQALPTAQATTPSESETNLPATEAILQQQEQATIGNEVVLAPPPGFDLPVDQALPDVEPQKSPEELEAEIRAEAFKAASQGLMPLKPNEIRKMLEMRDETQQAMNVPIVPKPNPESTFQTISLEPGQPPIEIKTAVGHVTTISFLDASGQPWPIHDLSWAGNFEVLQPEVGSNMLRVTPLGDYAFGNVSLRMVGLNPPIIMSFKTERRSVQVRADIQIPEMGPNAVVAPIAQPVSITAGDAKLATILEGVQPSKATKMTVSGTDGRTSAYAMDGIVYVRTPLTLLSPAWNGSVRSSDGMNVYAMKYSPVLLLSDNGTMVRAQLSRMEDPDEQ
jgi:intracellular multiplication protein IcmK